MAGGEAAGEVTLAGVARRYREGNRTRVVLENAGARFAPGSFTVVLGRSGSGKSTLLNLVAGIDVPDAGTIEVDGTRLDRLDERRRTLFRRRHVGLVFQFFNLIPTLTVAENVMLPLELTGAGSRESRRRALEFLQRVSLADRADSFPDRLSGGEQQRVAVARALVHGPSLVLADEPTGNLDTAAADNVLGLLQALSASGGATVIMATHSAEAAGRGDHVLTIDGGRLVPGAC